MNDPATIQEFNTSSRYSPPPGIKPWQIRNDYPPTSDEKPEWLGINFLQDEHGARAYCEAVKEYILKGNAEHNFAVELNQDRDWYHPPWLHYGERGREPISGLKFGGQLSRKYVSENQSHILQGWLCSYFNAPAATVLHKMWGNQDKIPVWDKENPVEFPEGSLIFENIFCDVTDVDVYTLKNAPTTKACIAEVNSAGEPVLSKRKKTADSLRLVGTDFAARDTRFGDLGWVFGTFIYDGTKEKPSSCPWYDLIPVGLQWGNDPNLTQEAHNNGKLSTQCWINGHALDVIKSLKGDRPWLGWHGRLDGVADDFMSTCTSCHATAQITPDGKCDEDRRIMNPRPTKIPSGDDKPGIYVQNDPDAIQTWFRNVPAGQPFTQDHLSADYNQHVLLSYLNYLGWKDGKPDNCNATTNVAFKRGY